MSPGPFLYSACGLTLASDAPIPGLHSIADSVPVDVRISTRGSEAWAGGSRWYVSPELSASGKPEVTIEANANGYRIEYSDATTILIDRAGRRISVRWPDLLTGVDTASYLTGYVLAFAMRLRGSVPVHASAVAIDGRAVLFVGDSWAGKSSTAAAFSILGYPVLSDDIVRIDATEDGLVAYPSHPRLNVWSDSATMLYGARALPLHSETYAKRYLDLLDAGYSFQPTPVPIEAIYVLGKRSADREPPAIRPMPPRAGLMVLVGQTYGSSVLDRAMRAHEFDVLCRLVERVPVRELRFGDNLGELVSSCQVLAADRSAGPEGRPYRHE